MAVIIVAPATDSHAAMIAWGLEQSGCQVIWWGGVGWKELEQASVWNHASGTSVWLGKHLLSREDTVWFRRPQFGGLSPSVVPEDRKFCSLEGHAFHETLMLHVELSGARCVNDWSAALRSENKSLQLVFAQKSGLLFPSTVMTNKSVDIAELQRNSIDGVIHKTFYPHVWVDQAAGMTHTCQTSVLGEFIGYDPEVFTLAPGIYQRLVAKVADIRITVMGSTVLAYQITSANNVLDWRVDSLLQNIAVKQVSLPAGLEERILCFMDLAGLVFGCLDFAVDSQERWWFLEVNQAGQFLWIDEYLPDAGVYEPMVKFLMSGEASSSNAWPCFRKAKDSVKVTVPSELLTDANPFGTLERQAIKHEG